MFSLKAALFGKRSEWQTKNRNPGPGWFFLPNEHLVKFIQSISQSKNGSQDRFCSQELDVSAQIFVKNQQENTSR